MTQWNVHSKIPFNHEFMLFHLYKFFISTVYIILRIPVPRLFIETKYNRSTSCNSILLYHQKSKDGFHSLQCTHTSLFNVFIVKAVKFIKIFPNLLSLHKKCIVSRLKPLLHQKQKYNDNSFLIIIYVHSFKDAIQ